MTACSYQSNPPDGSKTHNITGGCGLAPTCHILTQVQCASFITIIMLKDKTEEPLRDLVFYNG